MTIFTASNDTTTMNRTTRTSAVTVIISVIAIAVCSTARAQSDMPGGGGLPSAVARDSVMILSGEAVGERDSLVVTLPSGGRTDGGGSRDGVQPVSVYAAPGGVGVTFRQTTSAGKGGREPRGSNAIPGSNEYNDEHIAMPGGNGHDEEHNPSRNGNDVHDNANSGVSVYGSATLSTSAGGATANNIGLTQTVGATYSLQPVDWLALAAGICLNNTYWTDNHYMTAALSATVAMRLAPRWQLTLFAQKTLGGNSAPHELTDMSGAGDRLGASLSYALVPDININLSADLLRHAASPSLRASFRGASFSFGGGLFPGLRLGR